MERRIKREQKVNDSDCKKHDERETAYVLEDEMCEGKLSANVRVMCERDASRKQREDKYRFTYMR